MIAEAIVAAAAEMGGFKCPVVVRLQGTNAELSQTQVRQPSYPTQIVRSRIVISHAISNEQVN
jgi:succinyl-CoA synthetase beta subunit